MNPQTWWYLSRASGLVAWVLLVASLVWGVLLATRVLKPIDRPAWLLALHRWLSGLAVIATAVHLGALVADSYVHFGAKELFVPMASTWQPGAVTVGIVGFYLLVLVQGTSLAMKKLPKRLWRGVHYTSYALVWTATVHAGMAGTDVSNRIYQVVALLLSVLAVTAAIVRITVGRRGAALARVASAERSHGRPGRSPAPVDRGPVVADSAVDPVLAASQPARRDARSRRVTGAVADSPLPPPTVREVAIRR